MSKSRIVLFPLALLISTVIFQVLFCFFVSCKTSLSPEADTGTIIFEIGIINDSLSDFPANSFNGVDDYKCTVGVDCSAETFPVHMYKQPVPKGSDSMGVAFVTIFFELNESHENLIFKIARAGSETTIVTLDDDKRFDVTSSMLGSDERRKFGSYDLSLGSLGQDTHSIHLAIGENNYGNGRYFWDALILISPTD
ncbi:MAG: hypothetical protein HKP41_06630 [Desulfobacterales bacterium]|nr:hypothetical protein [Desulfobacterales bacterium]